MTQISTKYRYHPESKDLQGLCKMFEERLPNAKFGFQFRKTGLWLEAKETDGDRYYGQLLRDYQEPDDIADRFFQRLKPKNPTPRILIPSSA